MFTERAQEMEPDGLAGDEVPLNDLASPPAAPQVPTLH